MEQVTDELTEIIDGHEELDVVHIDAFNVASKDVWEFITIRCSGSLLPHRWPMSGDNRAMYPYAGHDTPGLALKGVYLLSGIVDKYQDAATKLHAGGKVWYADLEATGNTLLGLRPGLTGDHTVYMAPNDHGGMTLSFTPPTEK